jgi:hypothetical protein
LQLVGGLDLLKEGGGLGLISQRHMFTAVSFCRIKMPGFKPKFGFAGNSLYADIE